MTHLTLVEMNPRHRAARRDLRSAHDTHRTVMGLFDLHPGDTDARSRYDVLWRIELGDMPSLLIQSSVPPDTSRLPDSYATTAPRTKPTDAFLESLQDGDPMRYRAMVNPAVTSRRRGANDLKVIPPNERAEWWQKRCPRLGIDAIDTPSIITEPPRNIRRNGANVPLLVVRVDGFARVGSADLLRDAIRSGVGRAKPWGCGLLTVARA